MTTTIVYHEVKDGVPCPDGLAAAWVAKRAYPDAQVVGWTYQRAQEEHPSPAADELLIVVDFSFPASVIETWIQNNVEFTIIDHHKTAQQELERFQVGAFGHTLLSGYSKWEVNFDMSECGATLAWERFFPAQSVPIFLKYIRDRDLWRHELPKTHEYHAAYEPLRKAYPTVDDRFKLYDFLATLSPKQLELFLLPLGTKALAQRREKVEAISSRQIKAFVAGYEGIPVVVMHHDGSEDWATSDVCHALLKQHPMALFSACYLSTGVWSLRSDKDGLNTDVGAIAKSMGGGGHHNAAGFSPSVPAE